MTAAERRALLGDDVVEQIHAEVDAVVAVSPPPAWVLAELRRIFSRPAAGAAGVGDRAAA